MSLNEDIQLGEITEALNGKIDLPENKSQSDVKLVVETYVNGTSWCRVYSDGYCEQGGQATVSGDGTLDVAFIKPLASTNYSIFLSYKNTHFSSQGHISWMIKDASNFTIYNYITSSMNVAWQASGYIS